MGKTKAAEATVGGILPANAAWAKIARTFNRLEYWLQRPEGKAQSKEHSDLLKQLVEAADPSREAILGHAARALICIANDDVHGAIDHRRKELDAILELRSAAKGQPYEQAAMAGYDDGVIRDKTVALAELHNRNGNIEPG